MMIAIAALSAAQVLTLTWTSCTITMHAGTASTVSMGQYTDCATTIPIDSYDWNGVTQGNHYELHVYVKNTGTETLRITYLPTFLEFYDGQAQMHIECTVLEFGVPCQLYIIQPEGLPEKDIGEPWIGFDLPPGKVIKVDIALYVHMVVSGGEYDWEFNFYGATVEGP